MTQPTTIYDILSPLILLFAGWAIYRAVLSPTHTPSRRSRSRIPSRRAISLSESIGGLPRGYGGLRGARVAARATAAPTTRPTTRPTTTVDVTVPTQGPTPTPQPRTLIAYATNTCDHPYDEQPLTDLVSHLYDNHWEVWNMVAESASPTKMRREHCADHGLVMR